MRAARFGTGKPDAATAATGQKRTAPAPAKVDEEELEKRRKRAERFGMPVQVGLPFQCGAMCTDRSAGHEGLIAFQLVNSGTWDCLLRRSAGAQVYMYLSFIHVVTGSRCVREIHPFTMDYRECLERTVDTRGRGSFLIEQH